MNLRTAVLVLAGLGAPLALLILALPIAWGYGGFIGSNEIRYVDPSGPAYKAGLRVGDRVVPPRGEQSVALDSGNVGTVVHIRVVRADGKTRVVSFGFVPYSGSLALQQQVNKVLSALTALGAFIVCILVVLRARDQRAGVRAAAVLLLAGGGAFCEALALVCGNEWLGMLYWIAPIFFTGSAIWAALHLLEIYPPNPTRMRTLLGKLAILPLLWAIAGSGGWLYDTWNGTSYFLSPAVTAIWSPALTLLFLAMLATAILDGMATAGPTYATPMRWLGCMWLVAIAFAAVQPIAAIADLPALGYSHYADILRAAKVFCIAFGVAYPVLRHRLIDLNILVSRATVFGIVSAIIVGIFIAAEWAIGKIFERSMGLSSESGGLAAQLLTLAVVLALGISARSIHGFVEDRMTKTFFRKRMRGLAEIERVAHEADASTDAAAVAEIAVAAIYRGIESLGVALYMRSGDGYERINSAGTLAFPGTYAFNEEQPLRLRRWQEPFEIDDESDERHHMLFVPMMLRGDVLGFFCCGPKPDRSAYLADEIAALSLLANHVGIATAMLARTAAPASLALVGT